MAIWGNLVLFAICFLVYFYCDEYLREYFRLVQEERKQNPRATAPYPKVSIVGMILSAFFGLWALVGLIRYFWANPIW